MHLLKKNKNETKHPQETKTNKLLTTLPPWTNFRFYQTANKYLSRPVQSRPQDNLLL